MELIKNEALKSDDLRRTIRRKEIPFLLGAAGHFAGIEGFPHHDTPVCRIFRKDKFLAIREVIERSSAFNRVGDLSSFTDAVLAREELQSTGIGHGIALAHGKDESISRVSVGLGICHEGLDFDALDRKPVHLLFVIGSHPEMQNEYLRTLSWLMRYLKNESLRQALVCPCVSLVDPEGSCASFVEKIRSYHFL
jgi:nitrogen PTS system EIIA component